MKTVTRGVRTALRGLTLTTMLMVPTAWAGDAQVRFEVPTPFRVGEHTYAAGVIAVHSVMPYSPTIALLEVWVNGDCIGMLTARRSTSEEPARRTEALFSRDDDGRLVMIGYRTTGKPTGTTFRFQERTIPQVQESGSPGAL